MEIQEPGNGTGPAPAREERVSELIQEIERLKGLVAELLLANQRLRMTAAG